MEISVKVFKYGTYKETEIFYFDNTKELDVWHNQNKSFSKYCEDEENEAGENLYKYKGVYTYKGKEFITYLDC